MTTSTEQKPDHANHTVIVGGGFAGVSCAKMLAKHSDVRVTLIDKNNYRQFQPLLYQVATTILANKSKRGEPLCHFFPSGVQRC